MLKQSKDALTRDKEKLEAWLASFTNSRESNRKSAEYLRIRRLQLISQLSEIFPIQVLQRFYKIYMNCGRIRNPQLRQSAMWVCPAATASGNATTQTLL